MQCEQGRDAYTDSLGVNHWVDWYKRWDDTIQGYALWAEYPNNTFSCIVKYYPPRTGKIRVIIRIHKARGWDNLSRRIHNMLEIHENEYRITPKPPLGRNPFRHTK